MKLWNCPRCHKTKWSEDNISLMICNKPCDRTMEVVLHEIIK